MKIPLRYEGAKYEEIPQEIRDKFEQMGKSKKGLYIHGPVGTGKTYIIYALAKKREERRQKNYDNGISDPSCWVYNSTEFLRDIKEDFDKRQEDKINVYEKMLSYDGLLILDDLGAEKMTEWVSETFYLIINDRYENLKQTIITSNFSIKDQAERIGDRTVSRIVEMCDVIELVGEDRRLLSQNKTKI
jgi:DNA replication protein DnaC